MNEAQGGQSGHPTGYAATSLPFWEKLDDGLFEEYCTEWLNFNPCILFNRNGAANSARVVKATRLLSGTQQRGADIKVVMENGEIWYLQCKKVQSFHPADVRSAIDLAEGQISDASQFVLITTCGLSDAAQSEISNRPRWLWWNPARLTTEAQKLDPVENGILLVHRFFGEIWRKNLFPWENILVPWQEYFSQDLSEDRRMFHHRGKFQPCEDTIKQLETFIKDGAGRALVLSGNGGQGKSRLLLELARALENHPTTPRIRFLKMNSKEVKEEGLDFISRQKNLALVVEDVHRMVGHIAPIAQAAIKSDSLRLLLVTRPQARDLIISEICSNGYLEKCFPPVDLPRWTQSDILKLAEDSLTSAYQIHAPRLGAMADRCPLLVVIGAALINNGLRLETITDESLFREKVFRGFLDDFLNGIDVSRRDRLSKLVRVLAFVSPSKQDNVLTTKCIEVLKCSELDLADDLRTLHDSGLTVENHEGIRVYPDLFADALLLDSCVDRSGRTSPFVNAIVKALLASDFPSLIRNLAQADWETRTKRGANGSFFDPLWNEYIRRFKEANWWERGKMLRQWTAFAMFQPERTLDLAKLAIEATEPPRDKEEYGDHFRVESRNYMIDAIPSLLKPVVLWHSDASEQGLDILWAFPIQRPKKHDHSDSSPFGTIANAASFSVQAHLGPQNVISWFEARLKNSSFHRLLQEQPWIISTVLAPYFDRIVEQSWQTGNTVSFRAVPLCPQKTHELRTRALVLAEMFATSKYPSLIIAGIEVLEVATKGVESKFRFEPNSSVYQQWQPARLMAMASVQKAIAANSGNHIALLRIRRFLSRRFRYDPDEAIKEKACELLGETGDSFELRLGRALTSRVEDEFSFKSSADYEAAYEAAQNQWNSFCSEVSKEIVKRFGAGEAAFDFLEKEIEDLSASGFTAQPHGLINDICKISPESSVTLLELVWDGRYPLFTTCLFSIFRSAFAFQPPLYEEYLKEKLPVGKPTQVCSLIDFIATKSRKGTALSVIEKDSLTSCATRSEPEIHNEIASAIAFSLKNEPQLALDLLLRLGIVDHSSGLKTLQALNYCIKAENSLVTPEIVSQSLQKIGPYCLPVSKHDEDNLEKIAEVFPKEVYEHLRHLVDNPKERESSDDFRFSVCLFPALGKFDDQSYVSSEIDSHWLKACSSKDESQRLRTE